MTNTLSKPTIVLHWATGLTFIGTMILGLIMEEFEDTPRFYELMDIHKSFGLAIFAIAVLRLTWRFMEGPIPAASPIPKWQDMAAKIVHWALLIATIAMPISGMMMSIGGGHDLAIFGIEFWAEDGIKIEWLEDLGDEIHENAVPVIITCLALHILGALKHQFIDKDGTISRMLGK